MRSSAKAELSSFFVPVPRRVRTWLPQWGQASGCFVVSGTRPMRGNVDIRWKRTSPYHGSRKSKNVGAEARTEIARAAHADSTRGGSRISGGERRAERGVGRLLERWLGDAAERSR